MIIWIASYPKSGNTWVRSFLASYVYSNKSDFKFDDLKNIKTFPGNNEINFLRRNFESYKFTDMAAHWAIFQKKITINNKINFLKTHNTLCTINGHDFANNLNSLGAIYIVRDPRDIVVSYSHHLNLSYEETFLKMIDSRAAEKTIDLKDRVLLGTWSNHYNAWKHFPIKKILIKYEDLKNDPYLNFRKIINYLNDLYDHPIKEKRLLKSIKNVHFNNLEKLEKAEGFDENPNINLNKKFFRKGRVGEWEKVLPANLVKKIEKEFKNEMIENNYLS
tara:strand:+ start:494 stop:1321 length:828 start_codon:yes stop_codon:yes gene_type:complete